MPILQQPEAYLSRIDKAIDVNGRLSDPRTREFLGKFAEAFADWIERVG